MEYILKHETKYFNIRSIFCESTENKSVKYVNHSMVIKKQKMPPNCKSVLSKS